MNGCLAYSDQMPSLFIALPSFEKKGKGNTKKKRKNEKKSHVHIHIHLQQHDVTLLRRYLPTYQDIPRALPILPIICGVRPYNRYLHAHPVTYYPVFTHPLSALPPVDIVTVIA